MTDTRREKDSLGEVKLPSEVLWGAQTQRSLQNFAIGGQRFPISFIHDFARVKKACAEANAELGEIADDDCALICAACDEIVAGQHDDQFPLVVWQTGSGTQTNMNLNEVIANRANELAGRPRGSYAPIHPNDHVNRSQSSNDVFPTVMHISAARALEDDLLPALLGLESALRDKSREFMGQVKTGRTHMMDATPVTLGQEFGGYAAQLNYAQTQIRDVLPGLKALAIGGSAVGTGLNTPPGWAPTVTVRLATLSGVAFTSATNKFAALAAHDALVDLHGRLRLLATGLFKIASDLRLLASGPRCGLGELSLPANEPGSSIMPGKVNPTQVEALTMVVAQVMGNDAAVAFAGSQGHLELNVFKPVIIHNVLESIGLLSDAMVSFTDHCVVGIGVNEQQLTASMDRSLMLVTALSPVIGYDRAADIAKTAYRDNMSLREASEKLGYLSLAEFDRLVDPAKMVAPTKTPDSSKTPGSSKRPGPQKIPDPTERLGN